MRWLRLLGLDERLQQARRAASEAAQAAEDRAELFVIEWQEEKQRLQRLLVSGILVAMFTLVLLLLLSLALALQFWDTPSRMLAIWAVVLLWFLLWSAAFLALSRALAQGRKAFACTRQELARDWAELKEEL
ncbi:MAG: phage holin family protein [Curvibacter sp.]|nr:phage holin family protein [Curvibacter sp.]